MKNLIKFTSCSAVVLAAAAVLPSCSMEEPFGEGADANLTLTTEIRGDVTKTRAIPDDQLSALREKCVVYIENSKGVIRKYKGLDNIPENIKLKTGSYVAEAWTGDSVSASFDAKFYRGWQDFEMTEGQNSLTLKCNIANVVVSVDPASLNVNLNDLKVTFSHSRGSLEFTPENIPDAKGYFMMPNADKDLSYKVEGTKNDGTPFSREGVIENVQRAHEYCMTITEDETPITQGGAFIQLTIADIPIIEEEVEIFPAPAVRGVDFDNAEQLISTDRNFTDTKIYVRGYFGLSSLVIDFSDNFPMIITGVNVLESSVIDELSNRGVRIEKRSSTDASSTAAGGQIPVDEVYITFSKGFLDSLPDCETEYKITFTAVDGQHKEGTGSFRIANNEAAIEKIAPVVTAPAPDPNTQPMAVLAHSATLSAYVNDISVATNYGIKYREQGTSAWTTVYPDAASQIRRRSVTRADKVPYSVTVSGLKSGTYYEYKAFCDDYDNGVVTTFKTEAEFQIPFGSFEEWTTYQANVMIYGDVDVVIPGNLSNDKVNAFWGSGNEGAASAGKTLTNKSTDMKHSGTYSARLGSSKAVGVLAAGNIFVGYYDYTDKTNGVLQLGRTYNGSHPDKVRVWVNYRPGKVDVVKSNYASILPFASGDNDYGQIYIALADEAIEIRTNPDNQKLFDTNDPHVLAYGQVSWNENVGADGQMQMVEIPFEYYERAKTTKATHMIIVACASKFGDYFSGSSTSVLYLDDFEFVYE